MDKGLVLNDRILSLNNNILTYTETDVSVTLTVNVESNSVVTATNGSTTINGVSSNGVCILTLPKTGTWTISATNSGIASKTETVEIKDNFKTSLLFVEEVLNDNEWSIISSVSSVGEAANYWSVGDRKAITLNGTINSFITFDNETYYAFIIGFDHNSTYEGTNRIHFQFGKTALTAGIDVCFIDSSYNTAESTNAFRMNTSDTNVGGWEDSYMRNTICGTSLTNYSGTFIGVLPSALRSVLKAVTKYTDNTGDSSTAATNVTATTDYIFLLTEYEVFGSISIQGANAYESSKQARYAYYSAGNSRVKYQHSATDSTAFWWLRSPRCGDGSNFMIVYTTGYCGRCGARYSLGFAPGFCV